MQRFTKNERKLPKANEQFYLLSFRLAAVIWPFPSSFPAAVPSALKSTSQRLLAKTWQFSFLFSEGQHFCKHFLKVVGAFDI
jgi:hypothetical protein